MASKQRYHAPLPFPKKYHAGAARAENIIGKQIAAARQQRGLSLSAFSTLLGEYGLSIQRQGLGKWESGDAVPSAYQLLAVCHALDIEDGISYFTGTVPEALNADGLQKLQTYKQDLIASGRYEPAPAPEPAITYIEMPVSTLSAAAGTGMFLDEENFDLMRFPASTVPAGAEFGIRVRGDSMEPVYQDGQIVWVKTCKTLHPGEVGIFMYDGNGYIKVYEEQEPEESLQDAYRDMSGELGMQPVLISYNEKYAPRPVIPELGFCIVGRVLG